MDHATCQTWTIMTLTIILSFFVAYITKKLTIRIMFHYILLNVYTK